MSASPSAPAGARKRILVVDDDPTISRLLERILDREYDVIVASDGNSALTLAPQTKPNLFILDVMMPGIDGYSVAEKLRSTKDFKGVPIIFLTAKDSAKDMIRGIQAGARHYLTKPFKIEDLVTKVKKALG